MLPARDWAFWLSLFGPLCVYNLSLKISRMAAAGELSASSAAGLVASDLAFNLGLALLWLGLLLFGRGSRRWGTLVLFSMNVAALAYAVVTTSAHRYFMKLGTCLDSSLVVVAVRNYEELRPVMASETPWLTFALVFGYVALAPSAIAWTASRRLTAAPARESSHAKSHLWGLASCVAGLLGLLLSTRVSPTPVSKSFARDPLVNLVATAVPPPIEAPQSPAVAVSRPTGARLHPRDSARPYNVALVVLESTGASVATPYSGPFAVTPFLAELAERGLLVTRAYTTLPHTSKALVSILCGIDPLPARSLVETLPGRIPSTCLAELLNRRGYRTVLFEPATERFENRRGAVENFGFQDFYPGEAFDAEGFEPANYFGAEDAILLEPSRRWIERHRGEAPFFAAYLTNTAHHDYLAPKRYGFEHLTEDEEHNRYLNAVRYQDSFLRDLYGQYETLGLLETTFFIILGDHGEAFGEHIRRKHDEVLYEEVARIPFVVVGPGVSRSRVKGPASLLDVLPTAVDLAGFDLVGADFKGRSVFDLPEDRVLWLSCFNDQRCLGRVEGHEKYIHFFDDQPDEIYDLSRDPMERSSLAREKPRLVEERRAEALAWRAAMIALYGQRGVSSSFHHRGTVSHPGKGSRPSE